MDDLEKIQTEIAQLQKQAEQMIAQRKAKVIDEVKAKIKTFGITLKELGLTEKTSTRAGISVPIKYRLNDQTRPDLDRTRTPAQVGRRLPGFRRKPGECIGKIRFMKGGFLWNSPFMKL